MDKPIIRPVEAFPMEQQDQTVICLRDPSGLAPDPMVLGMGAYFLVTLFDGTNSTLDLQAAFSHRFGEVIPSEKIRELVSALDHAYFLDSPAFAERVRGVREEFRQSPSRPAALGRKLPAQRVEKARHTRIAGWTLAVAHHLMERADQDRRHLVALDTQRPGEKERLELDRMFVAMEHLVRKQVPAPRARVARGKPLDESAIRRHRAERSEIVLARRAEQLRAPAVVRGA